jgi:hypothetical protein
VPGQEILARRLLAPAEEEAGREDADEVKKDNREIDAPL